jgi:chromosome segregation ATPase
MEDKQFNQLSDLITRCFTGIQELQQDQKELKTDVAGLKTDVAGLKTDVAELKEGQKRLEQGQTRLEKELRENNKVLDFMAGESMRVKIRVDALEREISV